MPILDGYDDLDLGPKRFPEGGPYTATIEAAKLASGKTQAGNYYTALDIVLADTKYSETVRVFLPADTTEWQAWEDWQRKNFKRQLTGLGLRPEQVENETARASLIGKQQQITVVNKKNGNGTYVNFVEQSGTDAVNLPTPEQLAASTPAPAAITL